MTLPLWADILIVGALPLTLTVVLLIWGKEEPENGTVHTQEDGEPDGGSEPDGEPPDSNADDVTLTEPLAA